MDGATITRSNMLRLLGIMAMGIGAAWVLQVAGSGSDGAAGSMVAWILGAASIAGAGAGLVIASRAVPDAEGLPHEA